MKRKKPTKKTTPTPEKVWTQARVSALYKLSANIPRIDKLPKGNGRTHRGEPHEWEWEGEPYMAPICLGCNATGDYVENLVAETEDVDEFDGSWWAKYEDL